MKKRARKSTFVIVLIVTLLLAYIAVWGVNIPIGKSHFVLKGASEMRFGIDIRGGIDAAFSPKDLDRAATESELEAARSVIETRLNQQNILDRDVTIDKDNGFIFVRFPWKSDEKDFNPDEAINELGEMAELTFKDPEGTVVLDGSDVASTSWKKNPDDLKNDYLVELNLKDSGRTKFSEATARLIGQQISIYMDDTLISSPTVQSKIDDNTCVITGLETSDEAITLSNQINSGALPFALTTTNYSAISPALGANALHVMVTAGILAFVLICIALISYYRLSGVVASISLLLQMAGQLILLTWPQFTVTLPGIAGIILSIGMGVDANIIVSERIREELRSGKTVPNAVKTAFKQAFSSVFDGNVTVLIVSIVMMIFGSGAMLSFAYTLLFGIIMNFVAGVLATRLMTTSLIQYTPLRKTTSFLSNKSLGKTEVKVIPFFQKRKVYFTISSLIIVVGIIFTCINGVHLDIQFSGGSILKYTMSDKATVNADDVANSVEDVLNGRIVTAQITTDFATKDKKLVLNMAGETLSSEELQDVTDSLEKTYEKQNFKLDETNNVAPFFSSIFLRNGIIAIGLSAILIILYVWFSFRKIHGLPAGVMALLSLFHDVMVVFFTFVIFQIPIGDSFIAVALTILGYSINDTIVIYDRIRENSRGNKEPFENLVNRSISQSFTRSVYTNLAVFISVALVDIFAVGNGIESIRSFALPMCIGTISGCYSTICISGPAWTMWQNHKEKKAALEIADKKKQKSKK
jgi:SecD/SecF fusion protein